MSLRRTAASALLTSLSLLGCTALLGTFEVTDSGPVVPQGDGGTDGPITSEASVDASAEAEAGAPPQLKCSVNTNNIRTLDVARPPAFPGGNPQLQFDDVKVVRINDNKVRVVARPSHSQGFTLYDFDPRNGGSNPAVTDVPLSGGRIFSIRRMPGAIGLLSVSSGGTDPNRLEIHRIADTGTGDQIIFLTGANAVNPNNPPGTRGPSADFIPVGNGTPQEFFWTFTTVGPDPNTGPFELAVGRSKPGVPPTFTGPNLIYTSVVQADPATTRTLFHTGNRVIMPLNQENNGPPSTSDSIIDTPDDGSGSGMVMKRSLGPPGGKVNLFFAGGPSKSMAGAFNAAFLEIDLVSTTAPITFRVGAVPMAKQLTFTAADVPVAFSFDSVTRLTTDGGEPMFEGDHFLSLGRGPNGVSGMNFVWYDSNLRALRANNTGPDSLLSTRGEIRRASVAFASAPAALVFAQFDLVWSEKTIVDGGMTETLFYGELSCIK